MKKTVRTLMTLVVCCLLLIGLPLLGHAAETPATSGTCGENLTWTFDAATGTLTISGTGRMDDFGPWGEDGVNRPSWEQYDYRIQSVIIEEGVTSIGKRAFEGCDMTSIELPGSLTHIEDSAFVLSYLRSITIPGSVVYMGKGLFGESSLRYLVIDEGVTEIGAGAFAGCTDLESVTLPQSLTTIGDEAFHNLIGEMASITIPANVTKIGAGAFAECYELDEIIFEGDAPEIGENAFGGSHFFGMYPAANKSWTKEFRQRYVAWVTWTPYGDSGAPDAPVVTVSNDVSVGKIKLSWSEVADAVKYEIYQFFSGTGDYFYIGTTRGTSFTDWEAEAGYVYYYKVKTLDEDGNASEFSNEVGGFSILAQPVVEVSNVSASGKINLSWIDYVDEASCSYYEIHRATSKNGTYSKLATTESTSYTDTKASAGKTYYYKVKAIHSNTDVNSYFSDVVSCCRKLARPEVKAAIVSSSGKIKLSWSAVDGAVKYEIHRATSKDGTYSKLATTESTSYTDTKASAGKTYYYKVKAIHSNTDANSAFSSVVSCFCKLARPEVKASNVSSSGKIKLSWKEVDGAKEYKIYHATSKSGEYKLLKTTTSTSYTTGGTVGKTYYYKVKAIHKNSDANSPYSEIVSRTCSLAQPVVKAANVSSSGKIKLSWKEIDGAEEYDIYRATSESGEYKLLKTTTSTSYTTGGTVGKTYYYKVKAIHKNSDANSACSEIVSRTVALARPDVSIKLNKNGDPKLSWDQISGATKYYVYRATSKDGEFKKIATVAKEKSSYTDTDAKAGKTYYYKVKAIKSGANSAYSAVDKIKAK